MVSINDMEAFIIPLVMGVIGIIMAMILKTLYDDGIIIDEAIAGTITITDLMTIVVVIWLIGGILIAAFKK